MKRKNNHLLFRIYDAGTLIAASIFSEKTSAAEKLG